MTLQEPPTLPFLADPVPDFGPALTEEDRAEIGNVLLDLLFQLHVSGELRPRSTQRWPVAALVVPLMVPGTGDVLAHLRRADGHYDLSISGGPFGDLVLLRQTTGPLADLFEQYFSLHTEQERRAKDRLVQGLRELMLVNEWGVRHYRYS
jgi:hypothetical protein